MATLFFTGDGEPTDKIVCTLEIPNADWFKRALFGALTLMCNENNWSVRGTATTDFARDKSCEMVDEVQLNVIIPVIEVGSLQMWPTAAAPAKWLLCQGQSLLRADYPALFTILGTTYGAADGTHFNLPDLRDKSPMGVGASIVTTPGALTGAATVALSSAQMPTHSHTVNDPGHAHTAADSGHAHTQQIGNNVTMKAFVAGGSGTLTPAGAATSSSNNMITGSNNAVITVAPNTTGITTANTGLGQAHGNVHPVIGINFIIYAGV